MYENILHNIAATKRREVEAMKRLIPIEILREHLFDVSHKVISMRDSILTHETAIIAEHKRRSPSKGEISPMCDVEKTARSYLRHGAVAMSVLTDTQYFGGSLSDLAVARVAAPSLPMLRKDFIVDEYQIYQSRILGADAILLIAAMMKGDEIRKFNDLAHNLGLQTLVEIHSEAELKYIPDDADIVGVNNRDLNSFTTDISNSCRLIDMLPSGIIKIAESGIMTPEDVKRLKEIGFDGFLIGEAFMSKGDPGMALRQFIDKCR